MSALDPSDSTSDAHRLVEDMFHCGRDSRAVFTSSKTNASAGDEPSWMKNPGRSGTPSSSEILCTVPTIQATLPFLLGAFRHVQPANGEHIGFREDDKGILYPRRHGESHLHDSIANFSRLLNGGGKAYHAQTNVRPVGQFRSNVRLTAKKRTQIAA
jgi:hypothetical protein